MSRVVRVLEPHQRTLLLGHGPIHWDTLPAGVRERVLALWLELLTQHLAHPVDQPPDQPPNSAAAGQATTAAMRGRDP